jgi:Tfp pilus assembly protein FimV
MAIRVEELEPFGGARIYAFPEEATARGRRASAARRRAAVTRRRAALGATVVVSAVMLLFAGGPGSVSAASTGHGPRTVSIRPGQTVWSLAARYAADGVDPRAYVDAVLVLNHLDGPPQAGAVIRLPR